MNKFYLSILILFFTIVSCDEESDFANDQYYSYDEKALIGDSGDKYTDYGENPFVKVSDQAVSTFSIDADGASYANLRRYILESQSVPPSGAVRTEELLNYFDLEYPFTSNEHPISLNGEMSICPWTSSNKLVRIGIKGKPIVEDQLPLSNYVFLIDVSGSMGSEDKLDLLKNGFKYMVDELTDNDRVAIVTYAGSAGIVLQSTKGSEKATIKEAIDQLGSGGGTAGAQGIITAYEIAQQNLISDGNNRIVIGTDGDFNIGPSSQEELVSLIEEKRDLGIYITVLGVGRGNLNDSALEQIANNGNGTYEYIDNIEQLKKVFIYDYSKFFTVAKDVKVQVEFDPTQVDSYRLIGYENRVLNQEDFEDDKKDAGEIGANQNITAIYEIIPAATANTNEKAIGVDFRYKTPGNETSIAMELEIIDQNNSFDQSSDFMKFSASIASFSMLITESEYKGDCSYQKTLEWLESTQLTDEHGFKKEFASIVKFFIQ
ncbi:MAG: VWA domain-containing protein [Reichenbachiella sp.]